MFNNSVLNNIKIPVLVVFGNIDICVLTQPIDIVTEYLNSNIQKCNIQIISGANHSFTNKYKELSDVIDGNM